jgi:hypothetical protein
MKMSLFELLDKYYIVIPLVQRDYAQGREVGQVPQIRKRFIRAIFNALNSKNGQLELDFIYGSVKNGEYFMPLDGQQRLTTLFLLYWYVAVKEGHIDDNKSILAKFSYETRHSSTVFCEKLVEFVPDDFNLPMKEVIINQPWYFSAWSNDPTINSMLTMLNAIQEKYNEIGLTDVWSILTSESPKIVFNLLPMEKIGLPDDLYIKMNSRGKELTEFEYFKSQFVDVLSDEHLLKFNEKIDQSWSDLFWDLHKDKDKPDIAVYVDQCFLRFFRYITDMLVYKNGHPDIFPTDDITNYLEVYKSEENVGFLLSCLDALSDNYSREPDFFKRWFYVEDCDFDVEKTRLFFQRPVADLVLKCSELYDKTERINPFSIGEQLLLFAILNSLIDRNDEIPQKVRLLQNLINNSEDTVRKENMTSLLNEVLLIMHDEELTGDSKFNKRQIEEEEIKKDYISKNNNLRDTIYKLEDHHLLQGCLAIFDLTDDIEARAESFINLFKKGCDYDLMSTSLFILGDYTQFYGWIWRMGNKIDSTWRELFTPSQRKTGFEKTKLVIHQLLLHQINNPDFDLMDLVGNYLDSYAKDKDKPKDFWYYYIKYPEFRKNKEGYYHWEDRDNQYECSMMNKKTFGGKNWSPFLYALSKKSKYHIDLGEYGAPLVFVRDNVACKLKNINTGYMLEPYNEDEDSVKLCSTLKKELKLSEGCVYKIDQNEDGIDIKDRVEVGLELISRILSK